MADKKKWIEQVERTLVGTYEADSQMALDRVARTRKSEHDFGGLIEDLIVGVDPNIDQLVGEIRSHAQKYWGARVALAKYAKSRLEMPKK